MSGFGIPDISGELEAELKTGMLKVEQLLNSHIEGDYPLVEETSHHLVAAGGKRLRPLLTLITSHLGDATRAQVIPAAVVCELTHLATLYHDDVMDEA
ncbi:MAG: polyprenyl synthetase family protein, partial [Actinobacteria bacterium]|nr:polyprenyl synthetase family protein [Actinomycetota bacterium]